MHGREPASFWRENVRAIIILLRAFESQNVVVVETSYELLEILSFCYRERAWTSLIKKISVITFPGCICFENARKDFQVEFRPRI